jgi:N-acyl-D-amino-acid deacylase
VFDILIRGGKIIDGTGNPWFPGDVGILGDRIAEVGNLVGATGKYEIDAAGKIVCPGFVDCHSHSDWTILGNRYATSSIYQGVTTEIVGNCGYSPAPMTDLSRPVTASMHESHCPDVAVDWATVAELLDRIQEGTAFNIGWQVGHGTIRRAAMVEPEKAVPSDDEMRQMERLVAQSLDAGAIGLSFGLEFMPGRMAEPEELRRLCAVAGQRKKMTSWHVRNRDRRFLEAVEEAIAITRAASAGLQLSHLSAKPGSTPRAWNRCMETVRLARSEGHDVQCDMIPYTIGPGQLATILPNWATEGTPAAIQARLRDPETRQRLMAESDRYWFLFYFREWDKLWLTRSHAHPEWLGMSFREIGEAAGKDPFDCVYDILADELDEGQGLRARVNGMLFSEGDVAEWISDPLFSIAADSRTRHGDGPSPEAAYHPNCYGWTPLVIQKYVHELRTMSLEVAICKMTSMPAARFVTDRGILRSNMMADVNVFDEMTFKTRATYLEPHTYAEGMDYVLVNGQLALEKGVPTGALAGRVLGR